MQRLVLIDVIAENEAALASKRKELNLCKLLGLSHYEIMTVIL